MAGGILFKTREEPQKHLWEAMGEDGDGDNEGDEKPHEAGGK